MKKHLARFLIIPVLLVVILLPATAPAATLVVAHGGYRYHGHNYRYYRHNHYYNRRVWVVASPGRPGYYRYW